MLTVTSSPLELRGIAHKRTKDDKIYYIINAESEDGTPHGLYCPDAKAFPDGLKKGDMIYVTFNVYRYGGNERLVVSSVCKATE